MVLPAEPLVLAAVPLAVWPVLLDLLVLLTAAMLLGNVAERLGQSVIVGYLLAGTLVGPHALGLISTHDELLAIAEIGVALLLFAIGLEFSPRRLSGLRDAALKIGPAQIILTTAVAGLGTWAFALDAREAVIVGMMVAMSSTACVLRLLTDQAAIETRHGRLALGILLVQDVAVVPMILLASVMATGGTLAVMLWKLLVALLAAAALLVTFYFLFNVVAPRLFLLPTYRRNRDLPILLAVIMATGSAWATHAVGLSPALGAFAAGILLATSPFAIQIRADTRPLSTLMITLFFAAIGMFGDPVWLAQHWQIVTATVLVIIVGKPAIIVILSRLFGEPLRYSVAAAICLAQVGEFSFVLATIAQSEVAGTALISQVTFRTMVSATIVTLLLTPYLVAMAPRVGSGIERWFRRRSHRATGHARAEHGGGGGNEAHGDAGNDSDLVLIIGFGSVGRRVAAGLSSSDRHVLTAVDMDPVRVAAAADYGARAQLGDATRRDILDHAGIQAARVAVITVRDHVTTRDLIHLIRDLAPNTLIAARCHYHAHYFELLYTGAHAVVDEESEVGHRLATDVGKLLGVVDEIGSGEPEQRD